MKSVDDVLLVVVQDKDKTMRNNYSLDFLENTGQTIFSVKCLSQEEAEWIRETLSRKFGET